MENTNNEHVRTDGGAQSTTDTALVSDVALITGSSRGIGRATAERLAADGASVLVNYLTHEDAAREVRETIEADGGEAITVQGDVSDTDDVERLFAEAENAFGTVDIVVNPAAPAPIYGSIAEYSEEDFDRMLDTMAKGTFLVLREAATRIADGGRIVDFSGSATKIGGSGVGPAAASKVVGEQLVATLAKELGDRGVRVNTVSPGVTETDSLAMDDESIEMMVEQTPLGRLGQPADIAAVVAFLVSDDARWITGQNIAVDGGVT